MPWSFGAARTLALFAALWALSSCGGGGGGDGGGGGGNSFQVTLDRSTLSYDFFDSNPPPPQIIVATGRGTYNGTLYVGATIEGQGINPTIPITISDVQAQITITPASGLAPGTYTGRIQLLACSDPQCNNRVGGTPLPVTYTVRVRQGLHVAPVNPGLTGVSGSASAAQQINVTLPEGQTAYTLALPTPQFDWLAVSSQTATSFSVSGKSLPAGQYTATIRVTSGTMSVDVPVFYNVTAPPGAHGISATPTTLTLNATEGASTTRTLAIDPPTWSPPALATVVAYDPGATGWLTVTPTVGGYTVVASAATLPTGTYTAKVTVNTVPAYEGAEVPVTFTVGKGLIKPALTVVTVTSDTTASQLIGEARIDLAEGSPVTWTATSTAPWLTLTRATGLTGTNVQFSIDPAAVQGWDNFTDQFAQIHITTPVASITPIDCDVTVLVRFADVTGLGPYLQVAGQSSKLIVRGRGFRDLVTPLARLTIDGIPVTPVTIVDDTQLTLDAAGLAVGSHTVRVSNALNHSVQSRSLKVIAPMSYAYSKVALNYNFITDPFLYDAERHSAYIYSDSQLVRFTLSGSAVTKDPLPYGLNSSLGLTNDGANLFVLNGTNTLSLLDADNPATKVRDITLPLALTGAAFSGHYGAMVSNDNRVWFSNYRPFDLDTLTVLAVDGSQMPNDGRSHVNLVISRNGARMIGFGASSGPPSFIVPLNALDIGANYVLRPAPLDPLFVFDDIRLSDDGGRVLVETKQVFDADFNLVGNIQLPPAADADFEAEKAVLSADGNRVYLMTFAKADIGLPVPTHKPRVYVFDSSTRVTTAPNQLPVLGYIEFDDYPSFGVFFMHATLDGGALLFVGKTNFIVLPIPTVLTPASVSPPGSGTQIRTVPWRPVATQ